MAIKCVYITAPNKDAALEIGQALVRERLAACVNIIEQMTALYWWEGEVQADPEVVLIAKTTGDRVPALIEKVKSIHSDDLPCILSLPVESGHQAFLDWIAAEVK